MLELLGDFQPLLHLPHDGEILVEFPAILHAQLTLHITGFFQHEIENAAFRLLADGIVLFSLGRVACPEQPLKDQAGAGFGSHRRGG